MKDFEHPLTDALSLAADLLIAEMRSRGGPTEGERERVRKAPPLIGAKGDVLLYGGKPSEVRRLFREVALGIAVLAFQPGGVTLFGRHWEAET